MHWHQNITNWERAGSIAVGGALIAGAAKQHRRLGVVAAAAGAGLIARGASGFCPVSAAVGRDTTHPDHAETRRRFRGVRMQESVSIARSSEELFEFWRDPKNLTSFMRHLETVEHVGDGRTHWVMRGPAGVRLEWDAEIINEIEPEIIAWRSLPGADVASAGSVHFHPRRTGETELTVTLQYDAPGRKAAAGLAWLFGHRPSSQLREDLRHLKQIAEAGEIATVTGQAAGRRSAVVSFLQWVRE